MKKQKLRIEDFLNNKLRNQTKIVGGNIYVLDTGINIGQLGGGGPAVTGGTGGVETNPTGSTGSTGPIIINDPNKM